MTEIRVLQACAGEIFFLKGTVFRLVNWLFCYFIVVLVTVLIAMFWRGIVAVVFLNFGDMYWSVNVPS